MEDFPGAPGLLKGSIVAIYQTSNQRKEIPFQYNPDTLTRRLTAQGASGDDNTDRGEPLRLKGPPQETFSLEIEIDAISLAPDGNTGDGDIYPALAALESLLYPQYSQVNENEESAKQGKIEIIPLEAPLALFVWGKKRTAPVRLISFSITEEAFNPQLNPIRAKVSLELQVLTYYDLGFGTDGGKAFVTYHQNIENRARKYQPKHQ